MTDLHKLSSAGEPGNWRHQAVTLVKRAGHWLWISLGLVAAGAVALVARKRARPPVTIPKQDPVSPSFRAEVDASRRARELAQTKADAEIAVAAAHEERAKADLARALGEPDPDKQLNDLIALKERLLKEPKP